MNYQRMYVVHSTKNRGNPIQKKLTIYHQEIKKQSNRSEKTCTTLSFKKCITIWAQHVYLYEYCWYEESISTEIRHNIIRFITIVFLTGDNEFFWVNCGADVNNLNIMGLIIQI